MPIVPVPLFDFVMFGGTGDLARRKLVPALFHRFRDGQMLPGSRVLGAAREPLTSAGYREWARSALEREAVGEPEILERFLDAFEFIRIDLNGETGWSELANWRAQRPDHVPVFYLAVSPQLFGAACEKLAAAGLNTADSRVVVEKPLGHDLQSANAINGVLARCFGEEQTFRIDHYLGKETVQNLIALRFGNSLFEPLWNADHVDHVQITVAEQLGLEGRQRYYEGAGAMRDMVQNHLLQLLCFVAMEPPAMLKPNAVRDEKVQVLRALKPLTGDEVRQHTVRGQYRAGVHGTEAVPGYADETGNPDSQTDTFVALRAEIANWRWAGVPFYLRTGKRLAGRASEIVVQFKPVRHSVFDPAIGVPPPNRLVIRLQPDEGMKLAVMIKEPGPGGLRLRRTYLDMSFAVEYAGKRFPDAYERLLMDIVRGEQTLFMRRDEVEAAWQWIDPILNAWQDSGEAPRPYAAGTWGPSAAVALIERDGRTWFEDAEQMR